MVRIDLDIATSSEETFTELKKCHKKKPKKVTHRETMREDNSAEWSREDESETRSLNLLHINNNSINNNYPISDSEKLLPPLKLQKSPKSLRRKSQKRERCSSARGSASKIRYHLPDVKAEKK